MQTAYHNTGALPSEFGIVFSKEQFVAELESLEIPYGFEWSETAPGSVYMFSNEASGAQLLLVALNRKLMRGHSEAEIVGICAHEATHVWQYITELIGEEAPGKEIEAYHVQWITTILYDEYKQSNKRVKRDESEDLYQCDAA